MKTILKEKLWAYIAAHNPELVLSLQEEFSVTRYLEEKLSGIMPLVEQMRTEKKPQYIIEELCLQELTAELKPSKYLYIREIVEEEFPKKYEALRDSGVLTYEIVNLIGECEKLFTEFEFKENGNSNSLRYALIAQVDGYLK